MCIRDRLGVFGVFGEDKCSMDARLDWVEENEARILQVGDDPLSDLWWQHADKPFQFLAFCLEYTAFQREGWGYVSHLPIALDGSCNGLQHFSAMVRDKEGGEAVNLVPADEPADVYQLVADRTMAGQAAGDAGWGGAPGQVVEARG